MQIDNALQEKFNRLRTDRKATQLMSPDQSKLFLVGCMMDAKGEEVPDNAKEEIDGMFPVGILNKRVEVAKLPISFTYGAKVCMMALTNGVPGRVVVLLIQALTVHEGKEVNADMVSRMYPDGFYTEEVFGEIVDTMMKERKVKWSELY